MTRRDHVTAIDERGVINMPSLRDVFVGIDNSALDTASSANNECRVPQQNQDTLGSDTHIGFTTAELSDEEENEQFWNRTVRLATVHPGEPIIRNSKPWSHPPLFEDDTRSHIQCIYRPFRQWISEHLALLICMMVFALAALTYHLLGRHFLSFRPTLWVPIALPSVIIGTYLLCAISELILLKSIELFLNKPPWVVTVVLQTLSKWLKNLLLFGSLSLFLPSWWQRYEGSDLINSEFIEKIVQGAYITIVLVILRNVILKLLEHRVAWKSFGKSAEEIYFLEQFIFDVLCYQNPSMPSDIFQRRFHDISKTNFVFKLNWIKSGLLSFPLEQLKSEHWKYSQNSRVEVASKCEVEYMAKVIFDAIGNQFNTNVLTFQMWEEMFHGNRKAAKRAFRTLFLPDSTFETKSSIDQDDFVAAFCKVFRSRSVFLNRLTNFANLYSLIHTAACFLFWICMAFFIASIFGYHIKDFIVILSTMIFSFSFATSKSISRIVESAIFVFGSRPYTVNDTVIIEDKRYLVQQISLLETRFQDRSNKIVRISNQKLCDMDLINLSFAGPNAISVIRTELSISTSIDSIERLRASILTYCRRHPEQWKPRVSIQMLDINLANSFLLLLEIESRIQWRDRTAFREADLELKRHVCQKLVKLGIIYLQPKQPVTISYCSESGIASTILSGSTMAKSHATFGNEV